MSRITPKGPMGRSALQSIFDLIEMHAHLPAIGPQLTFEAEKDLLEEVMWLRQSISHQLGWNLPLPSRPVLEAEPIEEPIRSSIHDRAKQFLEANPEEAAYWRRMHNRTSEDIIQQGPVPVEVQIKSALWELRKRRAAGATDEEAVAALFEANSVEELGPLMRFFQDKEPKSMSTIPQSGVSSWGDNPGSSEPKPHGLVTDSEGRTTDSEGHPHFWGSEADSEEAEQTSCGEVDASDFSGPESIQITIPLDPVNVVRGAISEAKEDHEEPRSPIDGVHVRDEYASVPITVARMVHYVSYGTPGGEYGSECRAAVVSGVRANDFYPQLADLVVLNPTGLFFNSKSLQSEAEYHGGTWHYPMQCRNNGVTRDSRE